MSLSNPHQCIHQILTILQEFIPGSSNLSKCVKENMFAQPNRSGFDQVIHYLCKAYDPVGYKLEVPFPPLDRNQERVFRNYTIAFVKDICKTVPEAKIPTLSPSFVSSPGGDRFAKFMWKFSLLVLKTVTERESGVPLLHYPQTNVHLIQKITDDVNLEIKQNIDDLFCFLIDACNYSQKLGNDILNGAAELKNLRSELAELVDSSPLSDKDKLLLLSNNKEEYKTVLQDWQANLDHRANLAKSQVEKLRCQALPIKHCSETVKSFVDSKTLPTVLDATQFQKTQNSASPLNLASVLQNAAEASEVIMKSLQLNGGFQCYNNILPSLENLCMRLQKVVASFHETKVSGLELASAALESISGIENVDLHDTPTKGRLQLGQEMLQDVQIATPALVFAVNRDVKSHFNSESPPLGGVSERMKSVLHATEAGQTISLKTPTSKKVALTRGMLDLSFTTPSIPKKKMKFSENFPMFDATPSVPFSFQPKPDATSTVSKQNSFCQPKNYLMQPFNNKSIKDQLNTEIPPLIQQSNSIIPDYKDVSQISSNSYSKCNVSLFSEAADAKSTPPEKEPDSHFAILELSREALALGSKSDDIKWDQHLNCETLQEISKYSIQSKDVSKISISNSNQNQKLFDSPSPLVELQSHQPENGNLHAANPLIQLEPKNTLNFEEDISPSGGVSLSVYDEPDVEACVELNETEGKLVPKPPEKRKSLQALIHRYHALIASSKQQTVVTVSPPSSPELNISTEDFDADIKIGDLNLDDF